jgi:hypothetical protein
MAAVSVFCTEEKDEKDTEVQAPGISFSLTQTKLLLGVKIL